MCSALSHRQQRTGMGNAACLKDTKMKKKKKRSINQLTSEFDPLTIYLWGITVRGTSEIQQRSSPWRTNDADQSVRGGKMICLVAWLSWTLPVFVFLPAPRFSCPTNPPQLACLRLGGHCVHQPVQSLRLSTCMCTFPALKALQIGQRSEPCYADAKHHC